MGFVVTTDTLQVAALKRPLQLIQLTNPAGLSVTLSNLGAGLWSVLMPDLVPESGSAEKQSCCKIIRTQAILPAILIILP